MANILPTKGNLIAAKHSRSQAELGFELMDKKRNILIRELMALTDKAKELQSRIDTVFSEAYESLRRANISQGGCAYLANAIPRDNGLQLRYRSVMGVEIPSVISNAPPTTKIPYGIAVTTDALDNAYIKFNLAKELIRELAETENTIYRLSYAIKKTQKRANALKNIVLPDLDRNIQMISDSLEEKEREEFVRQKVIKSDKQKSGKSLFPLLTGGQPAGRAK